MKKGYSTLIFSVLVGLVVLAVIFVSISSLRHVSEKAATIEIQNFYQSFQARVGHQMQRPPGSQENVSFSVPSSVDKICFFDASQSYDYLRHPAIAALFEGDNEHNLFLLSKEDFFPFLIKDIKVEKNPLCAKPSDSKVEFQLSTTNEGIAVDVNEYQEDISCTSVLLHGNPESKIDVVFVSFGFKSLADYNEKLNEYVSTILLEFEPFKSNREKFNFYRVDAKDIDCTVSDFIRCDNFQIQQKAAQCPNDHVILLVDRSGVSDLVRPVRSSAIGNLIKLNTADKPFVLVHEFGHTFGDLADEYVDDRYYSTQNFDVGSYPNCDITPCTKWSTTENTSCYGGCSLARYYRPTKESVMRSLNSPEYGPVNEEELRRRLLFYE